MDVTKGIHYQDRCVVTPPLQVNETTSSALWLWYFWQRKGFRNPSVFGHSLGISRYLPTFTGTKANVLTQL